MGWQEDDVTVEIMLMHMREDDVRAFVLERDALRAIPLSSEESPLSNLPTDPPPPAFRDTEPCSAPVTERSGR